MTFDVIPPLKSVNVDMRRSQDARHAIKQVLLLWCLLQVQPRHWHQQELQDPCLMRSWKNSTNSLSNAYVVAGRNMVTNVRTQPHWRQSQALLLIWFLHQVQPPHWLPYGKKKASYATIAKAKTMIHENVPISCAPYAMSMVT